MDETDENLENTGFLLQKLQELKDWQKYQEEQLLKTQNLHLNEMFNKVSLESGQNMKNSDAKNEHLEENDSENDDTTIDQDLSSLHSEMVIIYIIIFVSFFKRVYFNF